MYYSVHACPSRPFRVTSKIHQKDGTTGERRNYDKALVEFPGIPSGEQKREIRRSNDERLIVRMFSDGEPSTNKKYLKEDA